MSARGPGQARTLPLKPPARAIAELQCSCRKAPLPRHKCYSYGLVVPYRSSTGRDEESLQKKNDYKNEKNFH